MKKAILFLLAIAAASVFGAQKPPIIYSIYTTGTVAQVDAHVASAASIPAGVITNNQTGVVLTPGRFTDYRAALTATNVGSANDQYCIVGGNYPWEPWAFAAYDNGVAVGGLMWGDGQIGSGFYGDGANLRNLGGGNIQPGTVNSNAFDAGTSNQLALAGNASALATGTVPISRLSGITSNQLDAGTWLLATNQTGGGGGGLTNIYRTPYEFGAVGDGVTDDTAALQAWLTYCSSNQVTAYLAPARGDYYKITSELVILRGIRLTGGGGSKSTGVYYNKSRICQKTRNASGLHFLNAMDSIVIDNIAIYSDLHKNWTNLYWTPGYGTTADTQFAPPVNAAAWPPENQLGSYNSNNCAAIWFDGGGTDSDNCLIESVFVSGFGVGFECNSIANSTFLNCMARDNAIGMRVSGVIINNINSIGSYWRGHTNCIFADNARSLLIQGGDVGQQNEEWAGPAIVILDKAQVNLWSVSVEDYGRVGGASVIVGQTPYGASIGRKPSLHVMGSEIGNYSGVASRYGIVATNANYIGLYNSGSSFVGPAAEGGLAIKAVSTVSSTVNYVRAEPSMRYYAIGSGGVVSTNWATVNDAVSVSNVVYAVTNNLGMTTNVVLSDARTLVFQNGTLKYVYPAPTPDANVDAYLTAIGGASSTISNALYTLVGEMKTSGAWTNFDAFYPFAAASAASNGFNLINTNTYRITWSGNFTNNSSTGVAGDGLSGYGNTHWRSTLATNYLGVADVVRTNNCGAFIMFKTNFTDGRNAFGARHGTGSAGGFGMNRNGTSWRGQLNGGTTAYVTATAYSPWTVYVGRTNDTAAFMHYYNNSAWTTASASVALVNGINYDVTLLGQSVDNSVTVFLGTNEVVWAFGLGSGQMTLGQTEALAGSCSRFNTSLSR